MVRATNSFRAAKTCTSTPSVTLTLSRNLINKGDEFIDLLNDPLIDELVPWYLGDDAILSSYSANIAKAGGKAQMLHRDQGSQGPPVWHMAYGIQIGYYLVDNTEEIGATRVIPKTHLGVHAPLNPFSTVRSIPIEHLSLTC